jgi:hypothetical protein
MGEVDTPCVLPDQSSASSLARCTLDVGSCSPSLQVLSAVVGHAAPLLLPPTLTHYAAVLLFLFFGFRMLRRPTYHSIPPAHYLPHAQASTPALHHCTARTPHLGLASPRLASPRLTSPRLASPRLASPRLTSPRLTSPRLASPRLASPCLSIAPLPCFGSAPAQCHPVLPTSQTLLRNAPARSDSWKASDQVSEELDEVR